MKKQFTRRQVRTAFILLSLAGFVLWAVLLLLDPEGRQRAVFFADQNDYFMDFYNTVYYAAGRTPYTWGWLPARNYLPLAYLIVWPFSLLYPSSLNGEELRYAARGYQLPAIAGAFFLVFSFLFAFWFIYRMTEGRNREKAGILLSLLLSAVSLFNFDRANQIILVAGLVTAYLLLLDSPKALYRHIGLLCLAAAAVLKLFPAFFGVLLLFRKRWKDVLWLALYTFLLAFLPFFWLEGGLAENLRGYWNALQAHAKEYEGGYYGLSAQTILFKLPVPDAVSYAVAVGAAFLSFWLKKRWKQFLLITLAVLLASNQQSYYTFIFLFIPVVLFLNEETHSLWDLLYLAGFLLILTPVQYCTNFHRLLLSNPEVTNTIALLMYFALILEALIPLLCRIRPAGKKSA